MILILSKSEFANGLDLYYKICLTGFIALVPGGAAW